jgi:hypothetical protein
MIANVANTVLGLVLVYFAVLQPAAVEGGGNALWLALAGIVVVALAFLARRSDPGKWYSATNLVAGAWLIVLAALHAFSLAAPLLSFWGVFWSGCIVAVVALWAALYKPAPT